MTSADAVSNLPPLQADEAQHGVLVLQAVRDAIATHDGWLAFDDYLRLVLYAPGLGYYSAGSGVLELGAGTGALAASVLTTLHELALLPDHYYILEVSADLRQRQQQRLAALPPALRRRVQWLDALPTAPIAGVILANEVADALPFKRFVIAADALLERGVALSAQGALVDADRAAEAPLRAQLAQIAQSLARP